MGLQETLGIPNITPVGASFLITLREGLEVALVLAIILAYLDQRHEPGLSRPVWIGSAVAAAVCVVAGVAFHLAVGEFEGKTEKAIEGILALAAAGVLTWMIFWMREHAREIKGELHHRIDAALAHNPATLAVIAFVAVAREGFETALFLLGAETNSASGSEVIVGGLAGLAVAALLGIALHKGTHHLDLPRFFHWTGALLVLFAAGLFAKGVHELRELFEIEWSVIADPVWTITSGPLAKGSQVHDFLAGLLGWSASPERIRLAAYLAYLVPVAWLYFRDTTELPEPVPETVAAGADT